MPIRRDLTNQQGRVTRLSNPITKEGVSNAHCARSAVGCILGIASKGNQISLSAGNLDISLGTVGLLPITMPNKTAYLLSCML
jgi:hypothetical protein